jgi:hypothetical protein
VIVVRRRIERNNIIFYQDEQLEKSISNLAHEYVYKILFDIGKDYDMVDLEPLIMGAVYSELTSALLDESYKMMCLKEGLNA